MKTKSRKFWKKGNDPEKLHSQNNYQRYNFRPQSSDRQCYRQRHGYKKYSQYKYNSVKSKNKKFPSRPVSPILGTEEYMMKKIQQTSAIIMKQLLNPDEQILSVGKSPCMEKIETSTETVTENKSSEVLSASTSNKTKVKRNISTIDEIHEKIMSHITKLNDGKKKNLINCNMSGYDTVIEQFQKQKRLEISHALRFMYSQSKDVKESSDFINSIIPDIGIKIEDLPPDLIEELKNTINLNSDCSNDPFFDDFFTNQLDGSQSVPTDNKIDNSIFTCIKSEEINDTVNFHYQDSKNTDYGSSNTSEVYIKKEICDSESESGISINETEQQILINVNIKEEIPSDNGMYTEETPNSIEKNVTISGDLYMCSTPPVDEEEIRVGQYSNEPVINNATNADAGQSVLDVSVQTEKGCSGNSAELYIDHILTDYQEQVPENLAAAVNRMLEIDRCISKLTAYRQSLFTGFSSTIKSECVAEENKEVPSTTQYKKKEQTDTTNETSNKKNSTDDITENNDGKESECSAAATKTVRKLHTHRLEFVDIHEKVLVIQAKEDRLLAGTESGKIIVYSLENGSHIETFIVSKVPITSLLIANYDFNLKLIFVGLFENVLKIYDFYDHSVSEDVKLDDSVQCMEYKWNFIFMGCYRGTLLRYSVKKKSLEYEDKFSDNSIMVLKATQEGARRVLLVGSRNSPICIRDAMTGLYMRTMENELLPTVYSLTMEKNLVYCGTTSHDILVYSFHDGKLVCRHKASNSKGIGCMKIDGNLLFASCHNGNVYIYDTVKNVFVGSIEGPGGVILSMEIYENQVIIGTMSFQFVSLPIPWYILKRKIL